MLEVKRLLAALLTSLAMVPASAADAPARATTALAAAASPWVVNGLEEPLIAAGEASSAETAALSSAIDRFVDLSRSPADFAGRAQPLEQFLTVHPRSPWRLSLWTNLGIGYYHDGYFTQALRSWRAAWEAGKPETDPSLKALADRAVGELARMRARVGHAKALDDLFAEIGDRPISGSATEMVTGAREGRWMFTNEPGRSYLCGPMALKNVLARLGAAPAQLAELDRERSGPRGFNLAEVSAMATRAGLAHRLVRRRAGEPIPLPSVVNWKLDHFAAIVEERDGRYRIQDPTFGSGDLWVSAAAIDAESSGYFLVPVNAQAAGWEEVHTEEAARIFGRGYTGTTQPGSTTPGDKGRFCGLRLGMCAGGAKLMAVSLLLSDSPVGYTPAVGPDVRVRFVYNQREAGHPAVFTFSNASPKWSMNFMSWVQDNPGAPGQSVTHFVGGGGFISYSSPYTYNHSTGAFSPNRQGQATLVRIPAAGPLQSYELRESGGSKQVFAAADGSNSSPRRVFLTQIVDPLGNALVLSYDAQRRLSTITDPAGRRTSFEYTVAQRPLLISRVVDPAGRAASLAYDSAGRLAAITDVAGLQSSFTPLATWRFVTR